MRDMAVDCCLHCTKERCSGECSEISNVEMEIAREKAKQMGCIVHRSRNGLFTYEMDGETHSLSGWAKKAGISHITLTTRLEEGMTLKDAMKKTHKPVGMYEVDGICRTVNEWAAASGIPVHTLRYRLSTGMGMQRALEAGKPQRAGSHAPKINAKRYPVNGRMMTIAEVANAAGLTVAGVRYKMDKQYMTPQQIVNGDEPELIDRKAGGRPAKLHNVHGKLMTIAEAMDRYNIARNLIDHRMRRKGMSLEASVDDVLRLRGERVGDV